MIDIQPHDESIEPRYLRQMETLRESVDNYFNKLRKIGEREVRFILLIFPGGEGRCSYTSNLDLGCAGKLLEQQVACMKGNDHEERATNIA